MKRLILAVGAACLAAAQPSAARVKLATLPDRDRLVVSLAHPEATLVEEERVVTLQPGVNRVDFSWKGVNIDADSIHLRALGDADRVRILNTSYPPGENALVWEIGSPVAIEARMRISYLLRGLQREHVYRAVASPDERNLALRTYLRLHNRAGEDLADADLVTPDGAPLRRSLQHDEIVELQVQKADPVAIRKVLRWDAADMPWDPEFEAETPGLPLAYVTTNDAASGLGRGALRPGKARVFLATRERDDRGGDAGEGVAFLGEDWVGLTPADRELRLEVGESRDVKVTQRKVKDERTNIRRGTDHRDVMWDTDEAYRIEIQNFKKERVALVLVEQIPGYWQMFSFSHPYEKKDAFTIEIPVTLEPEAKQTVTLNYKRLNVQGDGEPAPSRRLRR